MYLEKRDGSKRGRRQVKRGGREEEQKRNGSKRGQRQIKLGRRGGGRGSRRETAIKGVKDRSNEGEEGEGGAGEGSTQGQRQINEGRGEGGGGRDGGAESIPYRTKSFCSALFFFMCWGV